MTVNSLSAVTVPAPAVSLPGTAGIGVSASVPVPPATATPKVAPVEPAYDVKDTLAYIAKRMEEYLAASGRKLQFSVDEASGDMVVTVRDADGTTIRQIPSEEVLRLRQRLESGSGLLIDVPA